MIVLLDLWDSIINKTPAAFWGIVFGSLFSFVIVLYTTRANDRRLRAQFVHDREIRAHDRDLSLRKDVYLAATEAISAALLAVNRFADLELSFEEISASYIDKSPAVAKVQIIAKEDTAKAVATFNSELMSVFMRLTAKRIPLVAQKQELRILSDQMKLFGAERDRMLELKRQYNLEGSSDQRRWNVIDSNFEFERKRVEVALEKHNQIASELLKVQFHYMKECSEEVYRLSLLLVPVVVAVRKELDLPIDEVIYRQVIEDGIQRQRACLNEFLTDVGSRSIAT